MSFAWERFRRLSPLERGMFFRGVVLLPATACGLRLLGLRNVQRLMDSGGKREARRASGDAGGKWCIANAALRMTEAASRYGIVRGNCLSKSIVLWHLLRGQGLEASVHVGGRKDGSLFEAHAWVELDGTSVNDSGDVRERFAPFESQVSGAAGREK